MKEKEMRNVEKIKAEIAKLQRQLEELEALEKPKMKKVKSLMTGKEIEIREDTPFCCDPSTETYWSM